MMRVTHLNMLSLMNLQKILKVLKALSVIMTLLTCSNKLELICCNFDLALCLSIFQSLKRLESDIFFKAHYLHLIIIIIIIIACNSV